jgi:hypothetical protein
MALKLSACALVLASSFHLLALWLSARRERLSHTRAARAAAGSSGTSGLFVALSMPARHARRMREALAYAPGQSPELRFEELAEQFGPFRCLAFERLALATREQAISWLDGAAEELSHRSFRAFGLLRQRVVLAVLVVTDAVLPPVLVLEDLDRVTRDSLAFAVVTPFPEDFRAIHGLARGLAWVFSFAAIAAAVWTMRAGQ